MRETKTENLKKVQVLELSKLTSYALSKLKLLIWDILKVFHAKNSKNLP